MSEETFFWIVQMRDEPRGKWYCVRGTLTFWRDDSIKTFNSPGWKKHRRRGIVRCIKVRVVPVDRTEMPAVGQGG